MIYPLLMKLFNLCNFVTRNPSNPTNTHATKNWKIKYMWRARATLRIVKGKPWNPFIST
jgi:hypothetical protein